MIRVNLLDHLEGAAPAATAPNYSGPTEAVDDEAAKRQGLVKFLAILLPIIVAYFVQADLIDQKKSRNANVRKQLNEFRQINVQQAGLAEEIERIKEELDTFRQQIVAIEGLSNNRSALIKGVDAIQRMIPEKVWLTRIEVDKLEMTLEGYAVSDLQISNLMQGLQDSVFFEDVSLRRSSESRLETGFFRQFEIGFIVKEI